jgi:hypothetical protein
VVILVSQVTSASQVTTLGGSQRWEKEIGFGARQIWGQIPAWWLPSMKHGRRQVTAQR